MVGVSVKTNNENKLNGLYATALSCLKINDPDKKIAAVNSLYADWNAQCLHLKKTETVERIPVPGRPATPVLVDPQQLPRRRLGAPQGMPAFVHAIAHIEFNAINLVLDALYRFQQMPEKFYSDWLQVAVEEGRHFILLRDYLRESLASDYGCFAAHNGLWEMTHKTDHDVMVRMALVPRVLEARGLDVTPGMIKRLEAFHVPGLIKVLEIIYKEEVGHVAIGTHWFNVCCQQRGLDSAATFQLLHHEYMGSRPHGALNIEARKLAGFTDAELSYLDACL